MDEFVSLAEWRDILTDMRVELSQDILHLRAQVEAFEEFRWAPDSGPVQLPPNDLYYHPARRVVRSPLGPEWEDPLITPWSEGSPPPIVIPKRLPTEESLELLELARVVRGIEEDVRLLRGAKRWLQVEHLAQVDAGISPAYKSWFPMCCPRAWVRDGSEPIPPTPELYRLAEAYRPR